MPITRQKITRALVPTVTAIALATVVSGCGGTDITQARIQASLPTVFTNLYIQQQADLGHPGLAPSALQIKNTTCDKGGPSVPDHGAGADWICLLDFVDGTGTPQPQSKFELKVQPNGCYTAGGSTKVVGPLLIQDPTGKYITNKVFEFDGCFDTTG
jgi:hypothetical protein